MPRHLSHAAIAGLVLLGTWTQALAELLPAETYDDFLVLQPNPTRIDFTDLEQYPVFLTDQYDHLGVNFETPWPGGWGAGGTSSFVLDGLGAFGLSPVSQHDIVFSQPIQQFGMWDVAGSTVQLYSGSTLITGFAFATLEDGFFGFQSGEPFDRIRFLDAGGPLIDDMVFTPIIPGPGAAVVLALGFLRLGPRRLRCRLP